MLDPSQLVSQYGYAAVAIGALLEGETILLMGGFAAHRGLLDLKTVIAIGFGCSFAGDQAYFWLGRLHGHRVLRRFPGISESVPRVRGLLDRYDAALILGIRFMVGLRTVGPMVMGMAGVGAWRFAAYNLIGAALANASAHGPVRSRPYMLDFRSRSAPDRPAPRAARTRCSP